MVLTHTIIENFDGGQVPGESNVDAKSVMCELGIGRWLEKVEKGGQPRIMYGDRKNGYIL